MATLFIATAMVVAWLSSAATYESQDDSQGCEIAGDQSLLHAKVKAHRGQTRSAYGARDCPEFGICGTDEPGRLARLAALEERVKLAGGDHVDETQVAWDCGSSGSNMEIVWTNKACVDDLEEHGLDTQVTLGPKVHKVKNSGSSQGCTVSQAFAKITDGQPDGSTCGSLWTELGKWARDDKRKNCFAAGGAVCWGAGTAGNRLVDIETDMTGWTNFKAWAIQEKICKAWQDPQFPSYKVDPQGLQTLTIPGTAEAAMEVETLISERQGEGHIAFGSAGGSSAQFGICLSCAPAGKAAALKAWESGVLAHSKTFKAANYPSVVDQLEGDFLNTYYTNTVPVEVWGVGSFLGMDNEHKAKNFKPTPMGGIEAMYRGIELTNMKAETLTMDEIEKNIESKKFQAGTLTVGEIVTIMKASPQGELASKFRDLVEKLYKEKIKDPNAVKFVAKTFNVLGGHSGEDDWSLKKALTDKNARENAFVMVGYAYMKTLGLLPSAWDPKMDIDKEETIMKQHMDHRGEEIAWMATAAGIGFDPGQKGTFAKPFTNTLDGQKPLPKVTSNL